MNFNALRENGLKAGFTEVVPLDCSALQAEPQVRQMCASCHRYEKSWSCPPACGTLEECRERMAGYTKGILVQTVGELEDELDGLGMRKAQERHQESMLRFLKELQKTYPNVLALGAGCCDLCSECTYPEQPCRFPENMIFSVESHGILVSELCRANQMKYYYGKNRISYTGCYLLE